MKGYEFDPAKKRLTFHYGNRVAMTSDGTMVSLLPAEHDYTGTVNFSFPDASKTKVYMHQWQTTNEYAGEDGFVWVQGSRCVAWVGARPQEWSQTTNLAVAPAGADFVALLVSMQRTSGPSHTWCGKNIAVHPILNQTVPFSGSVLLETGDPGLARAASIYIDPVTQRLVLHRQQSVSAAPGGFGSHSGSIPARSEYWGSDWRPDSHQGIPVWAGTGAPNRRNSTRVLPDSPFPPFQYDACDKGGSMQCSTSDPTKYGSTWRFQITAMFGRRSRG